MMSLRRVALWGLPLCLLWPLTACADIGQSLAKMNIAAMSADDYFQSSAEVALVEAASRGDRQGIKTAVANGANLNAVGKNGMTPLFWVIAIDPNLNGLQYLLDEDADPNITTTVSGEIRDSETTATVLAYTQPDPRFMRVLLDAGARAKPSLLLKTGLDERLAHLKIVIEHGADVNHRMRFGSTPMKEALYSRDFKAALLYLQSGADPTATDMHDNSPITFLKKRHDRFERSSEPDSGYAELVQALKENGYLEADF